MTTSIQTIPFGHLNINRDNVLNLLGGSSDYAFMINDYLDELFEKGQSIFNIQSGYQIFDTISLDIPNQIIKIENEQFNVKKVVFNMLKKSNKIAVFVCTAGIEIQNLSKKYMMEGDMLKGYIYDMFGSVVVESGMDLIQESLKNEMTIEGFNTSNRYSPGYCGWDVAEQKTLFKLLPPQFNFVSLNESCLMQPIKSISGIIGIGKEVRFNNYTCQICDSNNCMYKSLKTPV